MRLNEMKEGGKGRIISVQGEGALRRRLMDMGLTPGTTIFIRKVAPLGDPLELHLRGYELTLRKDAAANILVSAEERECCPHHEHRRHMYSFRGRRR
jgi:Fe2+ transport system protein FeoA